jgi:hypothetical protein
MASTLGPRFWTAAAVVYASLLPLGARADEVLCDAAETSRFTSDFALVASLGGEVSVPAGCVLALGSELPTVQPGKTVLVHGNSGKIRRGPFAGQLRFFRVAVDGSLTIEYVTIDGGHAPDGANGSDANTLSSAGTGGTGADGGAIYNEGTLTLDHVTLTNNTAGNGGRGGACYAGTFNSHGAGWGGLGGHGGAIYNKGLLRISYSTLAHNRAGRGGDGGSCATGNSTADGGGGNVGGSGGAIWSAPGKAVIVYWSTIFDNSAGRGGDGGSGSGSNTTEIGGAGGSGGGLFAGGRLYIDDSKVEANKAGSGGDVNGSNRPAGDAGNGGGVWIVQDPNFEPPDVPYALEIHRSTFSFNLGGNAGASSGAGYAKQGNGGGLYAKLSVQKTSTIEDSTFANNKAKDETCGTSTTGYGEGGAIYFKATDEQDPPLVGSLNLANDTFSGNLPGTGFSCQGALAGTTGTVYNAAGTVRIGNTILLDAGFFRDSGTTSYKRPTLACGGGGTFVNLGPSNNIVWSLSPDGGIGNLLGCPNTTGNPIRNADPLLGGPMLMDDIGGNGPAPLSAPPTLVPQTGSPAINHAGDGITSLKYTSTDERGVARPQGANGDIGAVEARSGRITQDPADATVRAPGGTGFTAAFAVGETGSQASVGWQLSTDAGATWWDDQNASTTTYSLHSTDWSLNGARIRAVFTDEIGPVSTNAAKLTVYYARITQDLPPTITQNAGLMLQFPLAWDANPPFATQLWQLSTDDGATWIPAGSILDVSGCQPCSTAYSVLAAPKMNGWKLRGILNGGDDPSLRAPLISSITTIAITTVPVPPAFQDPTRYPADSFAIELDPQVPAHFSAFPQGFPPPTIGWQKWDPLASAWNDLANGDPTDAFAYRFDTGADPSGAANLSFETSGDQDGSRYRAVLDGNVFSREATLYVAVRTALVVDCPSMVLPSSTFTCNVRVIAIPLRGGPRERKPCGPVQVVPASGGSCNLDADGQCALHVDATWVGLELVGPTVPVEFSYDGVDPATTKPPQDCGNGAPLDVASDVLSAPIRSASCIPPPITVCPAPQEVAADASCTAQVPDFASLTVLGPCAVPFITDCPATLVQEPAPGTPVGIGAHDITLTASSRAGQTVCHTTFTVNGTPPTITLTGANPMTVECHESFTDPGATATGCAGGSVPVVASGTVDPSTPGTYTITYTAGSAHTTRTVNVVDTTKPAITLTGANPMTLTCHAPYVEPGATANDACAGSVSVTPSGTVNGDVPGAYTITYTATDPSGNLATATRTVNVIAVDPPTITLDGSSSVTLECHGAPYTEPGAVGHNACGGGSGAATASGTVDVNTPGTYTITYTYSDQFGNAATPVTRTVKVVDTTKPAISLNGGNPTTVECHGNYTELGAVANDACAGSFAATASGTVNVNAPGTYTITYNAKDPSGNAAVPVTRTVNVADTTPPTIQCPANVVLPALPGTCAAPASYSARASDVCDGAPRIGYSIAPGSSFGVGTTTVTATATDASGNQNSCSFTVTITSTPTNVAVSLSPSSQQYSDAETLTATVTNLLNNAAVPGGTVTFKIGSSTVGTASVNGSGVASLSLNLVESALLAKADVAPGPHTVTAIYNGDLACYGASSSTSTLTVKKEDARTTYTGSVYSSTSCPTCSAAIVTLSATVWDVTATPDANGDAAPGDIRNATVTFVWIEGNKDIGTVPVGLVNAGDTKVGAATYNWNADIGSSDSESYTIGIRVDGFYTRNSSNDETVVTIAKPIASNFISGGGFLVLTSSGGLKPGDPGSKNNFGFNVKYNKSGNNLQGRVNTIVRHLERDGLVHVYQIKGNVMTSLSVNVKAGAASFNGKASIQDVTDPLNVLAIDGNASLQITMSDKGEPGSADTIGITLWNKAGGLWFSSAYQDGKTVEQLLAGGNLVVR